MPNYKRGIKKTDPGAVDDNAMSRAMRRKKDMMKQLDSGRKDYNEYDVMNDALDSASEPDSVRKLFED
jgi:hypothetical protein